MTPEWFLSSKKPFKKKILHGTPIFPPAPWQPGLPRRGDSFQEENTSFTNPSFHLSHRASLLSIRTQVGWSHGKKLNPATEASLENFTTDKRQSNPRRKTYPAFSWKPLDDIIDLDSSSSTPLRKYLINIKGNKNMAETSLHSKGTDSSLLVEDNLLSAGTPPPAPTSKSAMESSGDQGVPTSYVPPQTARRGQPLLTAAGMVVIVAREASQIPGPNGRMYRVQSGPPGPDGPAGRRGCWGRRGYPGIKGDKGDKGPEGDEGRNGDPGPPGPAGMPTLYLWRNTMDEWAAFRAQRGPTGLRGETGQPGVQVVDRGVPDTQESRGAEETGALRATQEKRPHQERKGIRASMEKQGYVEIEGNLAGRANQALRGYRVSVVWRDSWVHLAFGVCLGFQGAE
nr:collagen alpha-1(XVII) chain-like [Paramormyrops kingsleyae]